MGAGVSCKFCNAESRLLFELRHTSVYQCTNLGCGLRFASPQPRDAELSAAYRRSYYPDMNADEPSRYDPTPAPVLAQVLGELTARVGSLSGCRLLDFGCGRGELSHLALGFDLCPTGIEFDSVAREKASKAVGMRVYADVDALEKAEPDASFELAALWEVIEHLREPWVELANIRRRMKSAGILLLSTPNADCLKAKLERARWANYTNPTHLYYFTRQSLTLVLQRAGFTRIREWFLPIQYPEHGLMRGGAHRWLVRMRLQGALLFTAENFSEDVSSDKQTKSGRAN